MEKSNRMRRRKILKSIGSAGAATGTVSTVSGSAGTTTDNRSKSEVTVGDLSISEVDWRRSKRIRATAISSGIFRNIRKRVQKQTNNSVFLADSRIFSVRQDDREMFVVSFPLESRSGKNTDHTPLRRGDIAIAVDSNYHVRSGKANITYETTDSETVATMRSMYTDGSEIEESTQTIQDNSISTGPDSVSLQSTTRCNRCKQLYGVICSGIGCKIGYATICYLVTGALRAAWCGAVVGDLCNYINKNSCEAGLNRTVCQIIGYC